MADASVTLPTLTAAFERTGSPYWLMDCIQREGLDRQNGFELQIRYGDDRWQGGQHATEAALLAGEVDFIDCDWLTLLRCRDEGAPISAVYPYGRILGGLVVAPDSDIRDIDDLCNRRIGVVNRRDKNWRLLRSYGKQLHDLDLECSATIAEAGSKTELVHGFKAGQFDAALVYWHQIPALVSEGCRLLVDIPLLLPALGIEPAPTTFFLFRDQLIAEHPERVRGFIAAFDDAVRLLRQQPERWQHIGHELLGIEDDALITHLQRTWHSRIGQPWSCEQIRGLWPLTQQFDGTTQQQFNAAFAWSFMEGHSTTQATPSQHPQTPTTPDEVRL